MARISQGFMGPFSGKLGPAIGATWKGKPYLRAMPRKRKTKRKKKEGEALNQSRFSDMHNWLKPLLIFLRYGFKGYSPTTEGFNAAKSYNLRNAFFKQEGKYVLDPALVLVSYGDLPSAENISVKLVDEELLFSWDIKPSPTENDYDQVMLLAYDPAKRKYSMNPTGEFRKTGKDRLSLHGAGDYHVYLAFVASDRSRQSNSQYLGVVII